MKSNRLKYGNKKIKINDDLKFDSSLEMYCFNGLKNLNIDFEFQKKVILIDKFKYNEESIRAITAIVDFVINLNGCIIYVDTKGFATEVSKIKYKMLKNNIKDEASTQVIWLKNKKEVNNFLNNINNNNYVNNQQSSITW
jgi:hypothetical protein